MLLPVEVAESSGVVPAWGRDDAFWTHNDSGWDPELFAVDLEGRLLARVSVTGARNVDWEELSAGPCGDGTGRCLYIADTGDNLRRRSDLAFYRVPEPAPGDTATALAERIPLELPHGPRDLEAVALLPDGRALLISKGWDHPVEVYRTTRPLWGPAAGAPTEANAPPPVTLERIQTLTARPPFLPRMVTGAATSPDGALVAVRTYETLRFYRPQPDGRLDPLPGGWVNLRPLREPQGEAVAFLSGGRLVLTSEAGPVGTRGQIAVLRCGLDW